MSSPPPELDTSSMFMQRNESSRTRSPTKCESLSRRNSVSKSSPPPPAETITVKDFFDFMKTAYQVYEHLEGDDDEGVRINWEELTKLTVLNHVIEQQERDLLQQTLYADPQITNFSKSETNVEGKSSDQSVVRIEKRMSCTQLDSKRQKYYSQPETRVEMLGVWTEANLNCKLNDVINEGLLDSILPYLVGYKKPTKTTSVYTPIIKKTSSTATTDIKKPASFGGLLVEKESRDRLGRRKSSVIAAQERSNLKQDGDVEIHVCDEVKGQKKDFRCPQKLLVSKMGYFADVTAGQRLEDMDISVHCDIQIFDWLMRWVKRDCILVADWPLLDPHNVIPILVSASFLQMDPLLHDCLIYCHAHLNDIVKTSTNLACLSDALLTSLAAMYTNAELEAIKDRKDKIQSRLYCKMILSLAEPVPEALRGHLATLATLFKCAKCNKLLGRQIAEQVPCQPVCMRVDRRGNVISDHTKDQAWSLNDYITWLFGELRSWRRVYWRLWADCHFLRCQLCDCYFPAYQMEWCSHHTQAPHMFAAEGRTLPAGTYPCCAERAYRYETVPRHTGCQFRAHMPDAQSAGDAAVMEIYHSFREIISMRPPQLVFPERLTRIVPREPDTSPGRLQCKEVFWWEGIRLAPPRAPLGLLAKLYSSDDHFNPLARPGSPALGAPRSAASLGPPEPAPRSGETRPADHTRVKSPVLKKGTVGGGDSCDGAELSSSESDSSVNSDEQPRPKPRAKPAQGKPSRTRVVGRQWAASLSARSNQDGQRRFEERAARQMRSALARRACLQPPRARPPPGGVYAKLEADWRERHGAPRTRNAMPARARAPQTRYK